LEWWSEASGRPARSDVEEVFETTDAFWAARRRESSRVRRLTWVVFVSLGVWAWNVRLKGEVEDLRLLLALSLAEDVYPLP
jgi:hypothetical protein